MKKFDDLTRLGRIRRVKKIIEEGLEFYDVEVKDLKFLTEDTNIFYKLTDTFGNRYAVKIYEELSSNLDDSQVEMYFLDQIASKTNIVVPRGVKNKSGDYVTLIESKYDTVKKRMAVYEWMDGYDLDEREKISHFEQIGALMAEMHQVAETIDVPKQFNPKRIDKVLYYAGDDYFYKMEKHQSKVSPEFRKLMDFIIPYLDERLIKFYDNKTIMIHGDFNPWNIKVHKGNIRLLDFEDASIGLPIHDIATLFFYYQYDDNYKKYQEAFYTGYRTVKDIERHQESELNLLMIARRVNFMNYILEINDAPEKYISTNIERVEKYLKEVCPAYFEN